MNGFFEAQISPVALNNIMFYPPPSSKNIYNVDLGYEKHFLEKISKFLIHLIILLIKIIYHQLLQLGKLFYKIKI